MSIPAERDYCKFPSILYLDCSPGLDEIDVSKRGLLKIKDLVGKPLVVTTKMDGSNVVLRYTEVAARNGFTANHRSFDMLKAIHAELRELIPVGHQVFGEWLYAKHSIHYSDLETYLQLFALYDTRKRLWESWEEVEKCVKELGVTTVPVLDYIQIDTEKALRERIVEMADKVIENGGEGVVVRDMESFSYEDFRSNIGKFVRENHVKTDEHWSQQPIVKNCIRELK